MFQAIIFAAMSLGFSATSMPGPMQAYLLNVTLNYGWRRALLIILSPLIVDGPIILVTVFLLGQIPDWAIQFIRVMGGLLLLWIAWGACQQLRSGASFTAGEDKLKENASPKHILGTAIAMNALSPGPYLFWSTVTGPLLLQALDISVWAGIGMLLAFYGTFLGSLATLVIVFSRIGKIGSNVTGYLLILTTALLIWFGTRLILADALGFTRLHAILGQVILIATVTYIGWSWYQNQQRAKRGNMIIASESAQD
jgi:threonine/homoserine/homoserine lactone efflux protein